MYVVYSEDQVFLSYIYMLDFVLDDGTGWLSAILCREAAVRIHIAAVMVYEKLAA